MARHRTGTTLQQRLARAVRAALLAVTAVGTFALAGQALDQSAQADTVRDAVVAHPAAAEHGLMRSHHCSQSAVRDAFPRSALVLVHDDLRFVSFARGWAMYEHRAPGTLVAVC